MATKAKKQTNSQAVSNSSKKRVRTASESKLSVPKELESYVGYVLHNHKEWIDDNPEGSLGELRERIDEALDQCNQIVDAEDDPHILAYDDIPEPLVYELELWENDDPDCTFSYRLSNLEEMLQDLDELIETFGTELVVGRLRNAASKSPKRRKPA